MLAGDQTQKRRLFQLDSQASIEGSVKHRIACPVDEVGDDDMIFTGQFWTANISDIEGGRTGKYHCEACDDDRRECQLKRRPPS